MRITSLLRERQWSFRTLLKSLTGAPQKSSQAPATGNALDVSAPTPNYDVIRTPGTVSSARAVPAAIPRPPYAALVNPVQPAPGISQDDGPPPELSDEDIAALRAACQITRHALDHAGTLVRPGITTDAIDAALHDFIVAQGAYPSPLHYLRFPKSVCTSVNNVVCHGIPDDRPLQAGDIVSIDVTSFFHGFHGDSCRTFLVGPCDPAAHALVQTARDCMLAGVAQVRPGAAYAEIGSAIGALARARGVSVCKEFIGHGVGRIFHCPPTILHYPNRRPGRMRARTAFTVEPCILERGPGISVLGDGWTAVTRDHGRAAQFELTVLVTEQGYEILT